MMTLHHQHRMTWPAALTLLAVLLAAMSVAAPAQASTPELNQILPRGGQRGTEIDVTLYGNRIKDPQELLFFEPGISVVSLSVPENNDNNKRAAARLKIDANAAIGPHTVRLRTARGVTNVGSFYVGQFPAVSEKEPNSEFDTPQAIDLNVTVDGVVEREDVDYYIIEAKKGQRITAEVEAMRLEFGGMRSDGNFFDARVAILDAKRFELAVSDDNALLRVDPVASVVAPEDGKYIVMIHDAAYEGGGGSRYRMHVGTFPRPRAVYPAGGKPGETMQVQLLGDPTGTITQQVTLPSTPGQKFGVLAQHDGQTAVSPNWMRITNAENVLEVEPNDAKEQATPAGRPMPVAFNGIIDKPGDHDVFSFEASKNQYFEIQVYARQLRSPLDSVLSLHKADGGQIEANDDDSGTPDSKIKFRAPEDGVYHVIIRDQLYRGGPNYVYRIEFDQREASLALTIPQFERYSQERQAMAVPRGNRFATVLRVDSSGFRGDVNVEFGELPAGVSMQTDTLAAGYRELPVIFEAAADAPLAAKLVEVTGVGQVKEQSIRGGYYQTIEYTRTNNNATISESRIERLAVAVTEAAPFKLELVQPKAPLVRNGTMNLKVVAHRNEGFDEQIQLKMLFGPNGVGSPNTINIEKGQNEAYYPLAANGDAPLRSWKIAVIGKANVEGELWVSTGFVELRVEEPYFTANFSLAAVEQGQKTELAFQLEQKRPFDGEARVEVFNLPNKVEGQPVTFNKESKEALLPLTTDASSPVGMHKSVAARAVIMVDGEEVAHTLGPATLRIDKPAPPKVDAPVAKAEEKPKPEEKPAEQPKPEKRLSRLEMLRLEQQKRLEEQNQEKK